MATQSKLTLISAERSAAQLDFLSKESYKWLLQKIADIRNPSRIASEVNREGFRKVSRFILGRLYCFYYDPKTKEDLPYYDRFPLVLILDRDKEGFTGLNLHYLPIRYRVAFLNKLISYAMYNDEDEIKRLRVTYEILSSSKRFREFRPCFKRYLYGHVKSKILAIQPNEWEVAVFLPMQQFKKAKPQKVWQESINEIRKH
jgi:hypothetical protein